jgi:hypothetical protein
MVLLMFDSRMIAIDSSAAQAIEVWISPHLTILGIRMFLQWRACRANPGIRGSGQKMQQRGAAMQTADASLFDSLKNRM